MASYERKQGFWDLPRIQFKNQEVGFITAEVYVGSRPGDQIIQDINETVNFF